MGGQGVMGITRSGCFKASVPWWCSPKINVSALGCDIGDLDDVRAAEA